MPNEMIIGTAKNPSIKQTRGFPGGAARSTNQSPIIRGEKSWWCSKIGPSGQGVARGGRRLLLQIATIKQEGAEHEAILVDL
jgi:hypothetical protein